MGAVESTKLQDYGNETDYAEQLSWLKTANRLLGLDEPAGGTPYFAIKPGVKTRSLADFGKNASVVEQPAA